MYFYFTLFFFFYFIFILFTSTFSSLCNFCFLWSFSSFSVSQTQNSECNFWHRWTASWRVGYSETTRLCASIPPIGIDFPSRPSRHPSVWTWVLFQWVRLRRVTVSAISQSRNIYPVNGLQIWNAHIFSFLFRYSTCQTQFARLHTISSNIPSAYRTLFGNTRGARFLRPVHNGIATIHKCVTKPQPSSSSSCPFLLFIPPFRCSFLFPSLLPTFRLCDSLPSHSAFFLLRSVSPRHREAGFLLARFCEAFCPSFWFEFCCHISIIFFVLCVVVNR